MTLHPQVEKFLQDSAAFPPPHTLTPEEFRTVAVATAISETFELDVEDITIDGPHGSLLLRIYRPDGEEPSGKKPLPVMIFYHGGGFVINDVEAVDPMCRKLAASSGYAVVSVDYRKAPEFKFPVPIDEALFAAEWVFAHAPDLGLDRERIVVAGESAGANLAAVVTQLARDNGGPRIAYQVLLCPLTDWSGNYASKRDYGAGYFLENATLDYFADHYLRTAADRDNPLASPNRGDVAGLPPALIVTAEYDPLRDEGERYGHLLAEAGTKVTLKRYPGMIHLFYAMPALFDDAEDVYLLIREQLASPELADRRLVAG